MAGSLNKVMLIGNLGKDPEVRTTPSGAKVVNFNIATSERYTDKNNGQKVEKTEWHRIVMWRGLADIAEKYLRKGSNIYVEGKLTTRTWDDQNGQKRYTTEIIADQLQMLGSRNSGSDSGGYSHQGDGGSQSYSENYGSAGAQNFTPNQSSPSSYASDSMPPGPEDDLPF